MHASPQWYDELPEFFTEEEYRDLSEEISRTIEVVHGHVIRCESPTRRHQRIARRLANALQASRTSVDPCLEVDTDVDVVLWRVPRFTFRRPDVVVYRCLDDPTRKPTAPDTVLAAEVTSPATQREDLVDKKAQYAAAGIPIYLVVVLDEDSEIVAIREFHLDAGAGVYDLHAVHQSVLDLKNPVLLQLPVTDLLLP